MILSVTGWAVKDVCHVTEIRPWYTIDLITSAGSLSEALGEDGNNGCN